MKKQMMRPIINDLKTTDVINERHFFGKVIIAVAYRKKVDEVVEVLKGKTLLKVVDLSSGKNQRLFSSVFSFLFLLFSCFFVCLFVLSLIVRPAHALV
jgi:uncharacterized membrane protein YqjE